MSDHNGHARKSDHSILHRTAENALLAVLYRLAVVVAFPVMVWMGARFIGQLDDNSRAIVAVSQQVAVAASVLSGIERRVDVLEQLDRSRRAGP